MLLEKFLPNCAIKYAESVYVSFALSNSLTLAILRFIVLLKLQVFTVIGLIVIVKYPTKATSLFANTR